MKRKFPKILTALIAISMAVLFAVTAFAGAADVVSISQDKKIGDDAYGLIDGRDFRVTDGKTHYRAYCSEHDMSTPTVGTKITSVTECTNSSIRKILYYGYGGPAYDQSLFTGTIFPGYTLGTKDFIALTTLMVSDANGHASGVDNSEYMSLYSKITGKSAPPSTFKVYNAYTSGNVQNLVFAVNDTTGYAYIVKASANTNISGNDADYSLAGAVYGVYSDKACKTSVGTLKTDSNGKTSTLKLEQGSYYVKETSAPKGYKLDTTVYTASVKAGETTKVSVKDVPIPKRYIKLTKTSADIKYTANNSCYSLKDAVYGIYSDSGCTKLVTQLKTDENGKASAKIFEGKYYVKEITAPVGYVLDTTVYTADISAKDAEVNVKDNPVNYNAGIILKKIDKDTGLSAPLGSASLENAYFEISYYAGYYTKDNIPKTADRTWVYKTKKYTDEQTGETSYGLKLNDAETFSEGDELYYDANGEVILPLGTIMIKEISAPEGYVLEGAVYRDSDGVDLELPYVAQITQNGDSAALEGGNSPFVANQVIRGDFSLKKEDEEGNALADVEFKITCTDSGESHTFKTDENGYFSSAAEYAEEKGIERLWFGSEATENATGNKGALYYGNYVVEEIRCDANRGFTINKSSFEISEDGELIELAIVNKEPEFAISTKAENTLNGLQTAAASDSTLVLSDTVTLENVYVWDKIQLKVWAVDKETGEKVKDAAGEYIEATRNIQFIVDEAENYADDSTESENGNISDDTDKYDSNSSDSENKDEASDISDSENGNTDKISDENINEDKICVSATATDTNTDETYEVVCDGSKAEIMVNLDFDYSNLEGKDIVFFSEVTTTDRNGNERILCEGKNLNDADETISFSGLKTAAHDKKDGDKTLALSSKETLVDVVEFKGLNIGSKYKLVGTLKDKDTGKSLLIDGKEITASEIFTAEESEGTADIEFTIDSTKSDGKTIVIFEKLYEISEGTEDIDITDEVIPVASHEDINSKEQSIDVPENPPETPEETTTPGKTPDKPKTSKKPKTGDSENLITYIMIIACAGAVITSAIVIKRKRKRTN